MEHDYYKNYYQKNREKLIAYQKNYNRTHPDILRKYHIKNRDRIAKYMTANARALREKLFLLLGDKCSNPTCLVPGGCTDKRCLQFDHINGGGTKEIRLMGNHQMIRYYLTHPDEAKSKLQVYCANCNWIKKSENKEVRTFL